MYANSGFKILLVISLLFRKALRNDVSFSFLLFHRQSCDFATVGDGEQGCCSRAQAVCGWRSSRADFQFATYFGAECKVSAQTFVSLSAASLPSEHVAQAVRDGEGDSLAYLFLL